MILTIVYIELYIQLYKAWPAYRQKVLCYVIILHGNFTTSLFPYGNITKTLLCYGFYIEQFSILSMSSIWVDE